MAVYLSNVGRVSYPFVHNSVLKYKKTDEYEYKITLIYDTKEELKPFEDAITEAIVTAWGKGFKLPETFYTPIKLGKDPEFPYEFEKYRVILKTTQKDGFFGPKIVDQFGKVIESQEDLYGGCYARVKFSAGSYPRVGEPGSKGITFYLRSVQKAKDGEPFGDPVDLDFEEIEGAGSEEKLANFDQETPAKGEKGALDGEKEFVIDDLPY